MLEALFEHLLEKPELDQDEMALFLYDEFGVIVTVHSISRPLTSAGWSKKATCRVAKERNAELRDFCLHALSAFRSYQLVYVNESECDKRIGFRRTGWSPSRATLIQIAQLQRQQRYRNFALGMLLAIFPFAVGTTGFGYVHQEPKNSLATVSPEATVGEPKRLHIEISSTSDTHFTRSL